MLGDAAAISSSASGMTENFLKENGFGR